MNIQGNTNHIRPKWSTNEYRLYTCLNGLWGCITTELVLLTVTMPFHGMEQGAHWYSTRHTSNDRLIYSSILQSHDTVFACSELRASKLTMCI